MVTARRGVAGVLAALLLALITVSSLVTVLTLTSKSLEYREEHFTIIEIDCFDVADYFADLLTDIYPI